MKLVPLRAIAKHTWQSMYLYLRPDTLLSNTSSQVGDYKIKFIYYNYVFYNTPGRFDCGTERRAKVDKKTEHIENWFIGTWTGKLHKFITKFF